MTAKHIFRDLRLLAYKTGLFHPACHTVDNDRWLVMTAAGFPLFCMRTDQSLSPALVLSGIWERRVSNVFENCIRTDRDVIVEVGANIGYFTVLGARRIPNGRYFAFEANPRAFSLLKANIALNRLWNVTAEQSLVADTKRTMQFNCLDRHLGAGSIAIFRDDYLDAHADVSTTLSMEAITLDERLAAVERVDILKVDAEGAEPFILAGAEKLIRRNHDLQIIIELNAPMIANFEDPKNFVSSVMDRGFRIFEISRGSRPQEIDWRAIDPRQQYELLCVR